VPGYWVSPVLHLHLCAFRLYSGTRHANCVDTEPKKKKNDDIQVGEVVRVNDSGETFRGARQPGALGVWM